MQACDGSLTAPCKLCCCPCRLFTLCDGFACSHSILLNSVLLLWNMRANVWHLWIKALLVLYICASACQLAVLTQQPRQYLRQRTRINIANRQVKEEHRSSYALSRPLHFLLLCSSCIAQPAAAAAVAGLQANASEGKVVATSALFCMRAGCCVFSCWLPRCCPTRLP
jgi:hypothetical protein